MATVWVMWIDAVGSVHGGWCIRVSRVKVWSILRICRRDDSLLFSHPSLKAGVKRDIALPSFENLLFNGSLTFSESVTFCCHWIHKAFEKGDYGIATVWVMWIDAVGSLQRGWCTPVSRVKVWSILRICKRDASLLFSYPSLKAGVKKDSTIIFREPFV